jgi:DNA-binding beta-propeller fold protein YncE
MATTPATLRYELIPGWEQVPAGYARSDVTDVAVDSQERIYLLCRTSKPGQPTHPILVYERSGKFLRSVGEGIISIHPHGLSIIGDIMWITDYDHTVRKMTLDGELLLTIGTKDVPDSAGGLFNRPAATTVGLNGDIYVAGSHPQDRVHQFTPKGEHIRSWGGFGQGPGELNKPHGITTHADGRIVVADRENNRIQFFSPDGEYLDEWTDTQRPNQIIFDADGLAYIGEGSLRPGNTMYRNGKLVTITEAGGGGARVAVFDRAGRVIARWGGNDAYSDACEPGNFASPHGLAVDAEGGLYVAEVTWEVAGKAGLLPPDCKTFQKFKRVNN